LVIANNNGDPKTDAQTYGNTLAHELGHLMGLGHRAAPAGDTFADGLNEPKKTNLMNVSGTALEDDDFDLIQVFARFSPALKP
jgi:hypothetical protein